VITMSRTIQVTFDCADPETISRFWAAVLGYVNPGPPGYDAATGRDVFDAWHEFLGRIGVPESEWNSRSAAEDPEGAGPRLFFQRVPEGKVVKNRVHLDLAPADHDDQSAEVERLIDLGARRVDIGQGDVSWVVMADPQGNEFCVLTPR